MNKSIRAYFLVSLKGMAMGAADVVPGVSGGTIAFISGIYEELISTIDTLDFRVLKKWKQDGFKAMFKHYNLGFLLALFLGMAVSFISLAKLVTYLLDEHPIPLWSFFFGLVIASIVYIGKQITAWKLPVVLAIIVGAVIAYFITIAEPMASPTSWYFLFLSGFIAIIAMILPGLSGSFILVLLGSYSAVMGVLSNFIDGLIEMNWDTIKENFFKLLVFALGCIIGLKVFSKALKWMFAHKKELTLAVLTGFMIGSLNKIWPWKEVLSTRIDRHGEVVPLLEKSILPANFNGDSQWMLAAVCAVIGFLLIFLLEKAAGQKERNAN